MIINKKHLIFVFCCGINTNYRDTKQTSNAWTGEVSRVWHITENRRWWESGMEQPGEKQPRAAGRTEGKPRRGSKGIRAGSFLSRTGRRRSVTAAKKENCRSQGGRRKMAPIRGNLSSREKPRRSGRARLQLIWVVPRKCIFRPCIVWCRDFLR